MGGFEDLAGCLSVPSRNVEEFEIDQVQLYWDVLFPSEYKEFVRNYGDTEIQGFLRIYGPKTLDSSARTLGPIQQKIWQKRGYDDFGVLPTPKGKILWGGTAEGDSLFLDPEESGSWKVAAFRRNWGDLYFSKLGVVDWLCAVLRGEICTDWMPEWPSFPLSVNSI